VLAPLVGEEAMHRLERGRIARTDPQRCPAWQVDRFVAERRSASAHDGRAGHGLEVHGGGRREIAGSERARDRPQVRPDRRHARRVVAIALKLDPAAIGEGVEAMDGGVLIHAHDALPSRLHGTEGRIVVGPAVAGVVLRDRVSGERQQDQEWKGDEAHVRAPTLQEVVGATSADALQSSPIVRDALEPRFHRVAVRL
jgi:hypothetical protein